MNDDNNLFLIGISKDHKRLYTSTGLIIESETPFNPEKIMTNLPEVEEINAKTTANKQRVRLPV